MDFLYPFLIAFILVSISELGDKTQLLVLSFSTKKKASTILFGVALGSFFSHGIAILFGSQLGSLENPTLHHILQLITYLSFIFFGIVTFLSKPEKEEDSLSVLHRLTSSNLHYIFIIATSIAIGELGDKTFLASIGLGIGYPHYKFSLILGAIMGMVVSDSIAIILGKFLKKKISEKAMQRLSGIIFLLFGILGLFNIFT